MTAPAMAELDKRATFAADVDNFCNIESVGTEYRRFAGTGEMGDLYIELMIRTLQGQDQRQRCAAALLDGLQPDLGAAQYRRAADRQRNAAASTRAEAVRKAALDVDGRRHHPGLRRGLSPWTGSRTDDARRRS